MTHSNLTGRKKRKRGERVFRFKTFCQPGHPVEFSGTFSRNMNALLEFGHLETKLCDAMKSWSFQLELHNHPPVIISLFIIEEPIEASLNRRCNHCKFVGWGHHLICNKKYHFVVPSKDVVPVAAACLTCEGHCVTTDATMGKSNLVELRGHAMYGVLHSNGFGHLLCVNGFERGSNLPGHEIMDFWDRICTALRARKVSLYDIAQRRSMDLRLLHGVAYGEPWFGRWGYKFGRGSFGVTQAMYKKAIEAIQDTPLCLLLHHFGNLNHNIQTIFSSYQALSGHSLATLGHLFRFMLELKDHLPQETNMALDNSGFTVETACRWSTKRVEMATRVIIEELRKAKCRWVSRQEVRDAARVYIGDTGLLDFVLKSLGNHVVGSYLVRRSLNPVTKVLEYCLEDISTTLPHQEGLISNDPKAKANYQVTRVQLMRDLFYLYKYIFKEQRPALTTGIFMAIPVATRIILDTKYLIKDYEQELSVKMDLGRREYLKLLCTVFLRNNGEPRELMPNKALPPYELIILPPNSTIEEFKLEVERTFRETYWGLKSFIMESIMNLDCNPSNLVFGLVEAGRRLVIEGRIEGQAIEAEGIHECGVSNYIVDCPCGTKDDDGERMISCDICEVRQHTRCVHISNTEDLPRIFLCNHCENDILLFPSLP